jgi:hypothetical protein
MTDAEFLDALERCLLPEDLFNHAGHVRAGYLYLCQAGFAVALDRLSRSIRAYASHHGQPGRYHETVTVAYLALIQQHLAERGDGGGWQEFARQNPELSDPGLLREFYSQAELDSPLARRVFVLPRASARPKTLSV